MLGLRFWRLCDAGDRAVNLTAEQRVAICNNKRITRAHRSNRYLFIGSDGGAFVYTFNRESGERLMGVYVGGHRRAYTPAEGGIAVEFSDAEIASCAANGQPKGPLWVEVHLIDGKVYDRIVGREVSA